MWSQELYLKAWNFAADAHGGQLVPGSSRPYLNHVGSVAMEVLAALTLRPNLERPNLAMQCAILHDVAEDTDCTIADIMAAFGAEVAAGVSALTKRSTLASKAEKMADSLRRLKTQPPEVQMVKLADRITNLQAPPPHWSAEKVTAYRTEAQVIHEALGYACPVLSERLLDKISAYPPSTL